MAGCSPKIVVSGEAVQVTVVFNGEKSTAQVPAGTTVRAALQQMGVKLNEMDKLDPPGSTVLNQNTEVRVTQVREVFEVEETVVPFERQTVRNESLPAGQTVLIQPGNNGIQQLTYRKLIENEKETSRTLFKTTVISEPRPEIVMVGVQSPFTSVPVNGLIAYLTAGNAWVIEESTSERRPLMTSGDLDGRVFDLSPDGAWLLFTRKSAGDDGINSLWMISLQGEEPAPVDLQVANIAHYAGWVPSTELTITYSTVEPRPVAPGWQANNDLHLLRVAESGKHIKSEVIVEANSGGIYGWWGTQFAWSPDGSTLAYARPDSVGLVNFEEGLLEPLLEILPYQTRSDWAWTPSISWSPDSRLLFTTTHAPVSGLDDPEESPLFNLSAIVMDGHQTIPLVSQTGMFASPAASSLSADGKYLLAYLQALYPEQSETSRYQLVLSDRDGSNHLTLFPNQGAAGLDPQKIVWASTTDSEMPYDLAIIYQENLWLINSQTSQFQQVTGDGLISRLDWVTTHIPSK